MYIFDTLQNFKLFVIHNFHSVLLYNSYQRWRFCLLNSDISIMSESDFKDMHKYCSCEWTVWWENNRTWQEPHMKVENRKARISKVEKISLEACIRLACMHSFFWPFIAFISVSCKNWENRIFSRRRVYRVVWREENIAWANNLSSPVLVWKFDAPTAF